MTYNTITGEDLDYVVANLGITRKRPGYWVTKVLGDSDWVLKWFGESDKKLKNRAYASLHTPSQVTYRNPWWRDTIYSVSSWWRNW